MEGWYHAICCIARPGPDYDTDLTKVIQLVPLDKRNLKGYTSVSDQKLCAQRA